MDSESSLDMGDGFILESEDGLREYLDRALNKDTLELFSQLLRLEREVLVEVLDELRKGWGQRLFLQDLAALPVVSNREVLKLLHRKRHPFAAFTPHGTDSLDEGQRRMLNLADTAVGNSVLKIRRLPKYFVRKKDFLDYERLVLPAARKDLDVDFLHEYAGEFSEDEMTDVLGTEGGNGFRIFSNPEEVGIYLSTERKASDIQSNPGLHWSLLNFGWPPIDVRSEALRILARHVRGDVEGLYDPLDGLDDHSNVIVGMGIRRVLLEARRSLGGEAGLDADVKALDDMAVRIRRLGGVFNTILGHIGKLMKVTERNG